MTYTIIDRRGEVIARQMSLADAAIAVIQYDGMAFELRREFGGGLRLWISSQSRNSHVGYKLAQSPIFSFEGDENAARRDIYRQVIARSNWFSGQEVMTDEQYDAMAVEIGAEQ